MKRKLDSKSLRMTLSGLLIFMTLVFFAITFGGISVLKSESKRVVELKLHGQTADTQLSNLERTKKDIEKYSYFKDVAKTVIPSDKDQAEAVLEINKMAGDAGLLIQSITFPASSLGLTTTTSSSTPATQSATTPSSVKGVVSQSKPVTGIPGLYSLELNITPQSGDTVPADKQITYEKMLNFLHRIENNRHTAQITAVTIQPASGKTSLTFALTINIFIKP